MSTFCWLLMLQGFLANALPRQAHLRVSGLIQAIVLCLLVVGYFAEPSRESTTALTSPGNRRVLEFLPAYWYLGVFQQVNGTMSQPLVWLAHRGWSSLALSTAGAVATVLLSYVRLLPKIIEQPEIVPMARVRWTAPLGGTLAAAITLFSVRTLLRSRQHRMILIVYLGLGLAVVVGHAAVTGPTMASSAAGLSRGAVFVSTLLIVLAITALRVVVALPIALKANWIFRVTEIRSPEAYRAAVRSSWLGSGTGTVGLCTAGALFVAFPWKPVLWHLIAAGMIGMLLVEVFVRGFRKVPFPCSYLPGKANIHIAFWASLILGLWALDAVATVELRMLQHVSTCAEMIFALAAALVAVRWLPTLDGPQSGPIRYEEECEAVITRLNLE